MGWTIYVRYGNSPVLAIAAVALAIGWIVALRWRGRRSR
jgi:apolipoprotein N-acyltransferase